MRTLLVLLCCVLPSCGPKARDIDEFAQKVQVLTEAMSHAGLKVGAVGRISSDKIGSIENALVGPWDIDVYVFGWSDPAAAAPLAPGLFPPDSQPALQP